MKSILMSIQPKWCELIASGKKTVEVRKTKPKIPTPFKVYIYCTKSTDRLLYFSCNNKVLRTTKSKYIHGIERTCKIFSGQIIGEFVCDDIAKVQNLMCSFIVEGRSNAETNRIACSSCLDFDDMKKYLGEKDGYAWHISELKIYDKPKELSEFKQFCKVYYDGDYCEDCEYFIDGRGYDYDESDCGCNGFKPLTRPPQSWCYVEEV